MSLLKLLDKGLEFLGADPGTASSMYAGSFLEELVGEKTSSQIASTIATSLYGEKGIPTFKSPTAKMISAPRTSAGSPITNATPVDLGYTARVQKAYQAVKNARQGSIVQQVVDGAPARQSRGPLISIGQSQINVASRARGN